jgi:hypothetical protein
MTLYKFSIFPNNIMIDKQFTECYYHFIIITIEYLPIRNIYLTSIHKRALWQIVIEKITGKMK